MSTPPFLPTAPARPVSTIGQRLIEAVVAWDEPAVRALLADDLWFRALLVRDVVEHHDAAAAMEMFYGWYGSAYDTELVSLATEAVTTRERLTYRVRLRPAWEPGVWHLIEQTGYLRAVDGRISRLDLTCTGFHAQR
jgi:hypothetical protein